MIINKKFDSGLTWFRRDLRVTDNAALCVALRACRQLYCIFIFDRDILDTLPRYAIVRRHPSVILFAIK